MKYNFKVVIWDMVSFCSYSSHLQLLAVTGGYREDFLMVYCQLSSGSTAFVCVRFFFCFLRKLKNSIKFRAKVYFNCTPREVLLHIASDSRSSN